MSHTPVHTASPAVCTRNRNSVRFSTSHIRRQKGSRDLRQEPLEVTEITSAASSRNNSVSSTTDSAGASSTSGSRVNFAASTFGWSARSSCSEDWRSSSYARRSMSHFSDSESDHEEDDESADESDNDAVQSTTRPHLDVHTSAAWPQNLGWCYYQDWPLVSDKKTVFGRHHTDSAIAIATGDCNIAPDHVSCSSPDTVTVVSDSDVVSSSPARQCSRRASLAFKYNRLSIASPISPTSSVHDVDCDCRSCRQIRHRRRKSSLGLFTKLEECRQAVTAICDPIDPTNFERGIAYDHYLKLVRLYVRYESLLDIGPDDQAEEERLFLRYLTAYNSLVDFIKAEAEKSRHLLDAQTDATLTQEPAAAASVVRVKSIVAASVVYRRTQSCSPKTFERQCSHSNYRTVDSNFF